MTDEYVIERHEPAGETLVDLQFAIRTLIDRDQSEFSEFHVAAAYGRRTITARWEIEECWAKCGREAVRIMDEVYKLCAEHEPSDIPDDEEG